jgi:hypothetical protein
MLVQFAGDDKLVQFLPDGGVVELIGLDDPVDGPMDISLKKVLDQHAWLSFYGMSLKAR